MPNFLYKILTKENKLKEGNLFSFSKRKAEKKLIRNGSTIIFISRENPAFFKKNISLPGFSLNERINFYRNFSTMGSAGLSILETLETLSKQAKNNRVKKAILVMLQDTKNGQKLSTAMAKFPRYFPRHIVETINMGDLSGKLNETIERIAFDLEKDDRLKKKIQAALAYPLILALVMILVILGLSIYILPEIAKLYQDLNAPLPQPTRSLLATSSFMISNKIYLSATIIAIAVLFFLLLKIKKCHYLIHLLILKIPVFGGVIKEYNLILFFRSLESLFASGLSLVQAVEIARKTTKNDVYKKTLDNINPILLRGVPLSDALVPYPFLFPVQTQKIIRVGEQTGSLTKTLSRITNYFESSMDYKTRTIASLIEPASMLVLGFFVGALAFSVFLPLYKLIDVL